MFGILDLKFGSLGDWVWDSVLGFVLWCLQFGNFEFGFLCLVIGVSSSEIQILNFGV